MERIRPAACPLWAGGNDFGACTLDTLLPLGLGAASALLLLIQATRTPAPVQLDSDENTPAASDASKQVFEAENVGILQEVQSNPIDPIPRPLEERIVSLDLLRSLGQTLGAVLLMGLHMAAWVSNAFPSGQWQLLWAGMWAYYVGLSYISFVSSLSVFAHQCVLQVCYVVAIGTNLRALLIAQSASRTQLIFTTLQLAAAGLFVLPTLFFPQRLSPPEYLRALYKIDVGPSHSRPTQEGKEPPLALELTASLYSRIFFAYATPLLWGNFWREKATLDEAPNLVPSDLTAAALSHFRFTAGRADGKGQQRSLATRLTVYFWPLLGKQMIYASLRGAVSAAAPLGTEYILRFIKLRWRREHDPSWSPAEGEAPLHVGLLYAALMCVGTISISVFATQAFAAGRKISVGVRSILISEVMTKALKRSMLGGSKPTTEESDDGKSSSNEEDDEDEVPTGRATDGQVNNLLSNDAMRVSEVTAYIHFIFPESPLMVICGVYFLFRLVGWSAVAGLVVLLTMLPIQWFVSTFYVRTEEQLLKVGDRRLNRTLETLQAIRTVKIFAWEKPFSEKLEAIRNMELSILRRRVFIVLIESLSFSATPTFATMAVFAYHTYSLHRPLTAEVAFTVLAYLNLVRGGLETLPSQLPDVLSALISLRRIDAFLKEDETSKYDQLLEPGGDGPLVGFTDGASFTYSLNDEQDDATSFHLRDLDLSFPPGLSIVVGPVGSGKSSLLLALLGEMRRLKGRNHLPSPLRRDSLTVGSDGLTDTVAYAPQTPWLLGTTIKENILFGLPYDEARFKAVLKACALEPDLKILEYGEETEVGEKGTALSGGQKARVGLARCLYSSARVLLIDDAFSALDASTSEHMYQHYLRGELARGRTIVMVTHAVSLTMPGAVMVVAMEEGKVVVHGPPESVLSSGLFQDEIQELVKEDTEHHHPITIEELEDGQRAQEAAELQKRLAKKAEFQDEEAMAQGAVSNRAYSLWMSNFASTPLRSAMVWGLIFVLFIAAQSCNIVATAWLKKWVGRDDTSPDLEGATQVTLGIAPLESEARDDSLRYLAVYALLSLVYVGLNTLKELAALMGSLVASARIYRKLIDAILSARPGWFDRVPIGRVMNRVAQDISTVDEELGLNGAFVMDTLLELLAVIAIIAWGSPILAVFSLVMLGGYWVIAAMYLHSARDYKRLESVQRSPIYTLLGDILSGNILIRACGDTGRFTQQCIRLIDKANRPFHALWLANRWLSTRISIMSSFITFTVSVVLIVTPSIDAAQAGFILSYATLLVDSVFWAVRLYSGFSVSLASVERIDEYISLPSEKEGGTEPPAHWPTEQGGILIDKLCARYSPELPLVLEDVTLKIKPGEKIGVCGRTGSGKSSLASCLFRFLEAEKGQIVIDGIDIATVPLATLRRRLTVISQQNDIFQGTVRSNLDPFNEYEDIELWNALERCRLVTEDEVVSASQQASGTCTPVPEPLTSTAEDPTPSEETKRVVITGLDMEVLQGGTNFSQGQRQLLALARGLLKLRDSRILILDESTASLDASSDAKIQHTIRTEMARATMLVVAHRLRSIADFDRVLLLDQGKVVEFASPLELLQDESSSFRELAMRSGEFDLLLSMATEHSAKSHAS